MMPLSLFTGARRAVIGLALAGSWISAAPRAAASQDGVRLSPDSQVALFAAVPAKPAPFAALSASMLAMRDSVVSRARAQIGKRYRHGGETPRRGFDCSGLVAYVLSAFKLTVPRTAAAQATVGSEVVRDTSLLLPGDLLTFGGKKVTHIGIYVGNGRFIQASSRAGKVIETNLFRASAPGIKPWKGARRLVLADTASAPGPRPGESSE